MQTVFVKPAKGGRVRMPERNSKVMPDKGMTVPRNDYYTRLLAAGDVVEGKGETPKKAKAVSSAETKESPT
jgi:Protein of unknown function (DUF2635)